MTNDIDAETFYYSLFGTIFLRASDEALLELHFVRDADILSSLPPVPHHPILAQTFLWLNQYFNESRQPDFIPPIRLNLTPFNRRVLEIASQVPFGETVTYGEIANIIAVERGIPKMSAQAVGSAMRKNPICLIIPCHRVIAASHRLGGYNGEPARKRQLLAHEGFDVVNLI